MILSEFLEIFQIHVRRVLSRHILLAMREADVEAYVDSVSGDIIIDLHAAIAADHLESNVRDFPLNWWEAVKERFAPRFLLRRFPVKTSRIYYNTWRFYPNKPLPHLQSNIYHRVSHVPYSTMAKGKEE